MNSGQVNVALQNVICQLVGYDNAFADDDDLCPRRPDT